MLTEQQIELLYPAEIHFERALYQGTLNCPPRWLTERVFDILDLATGEKTSRQYGCAVCIYNAYKKLGKLYFETLEALRTKDDKNIKNYKDASRNKSRSKGSKNKDNKRGNT